MHALALMDHLKVCSAGIQVSWIPESRRAYVGAAAGCYLLLLALKKKNIAACGSSYTDIANKKGDAL
jgi:hypothetical protein